MVWKGKERILEKKIAELKKLRSLPAKTTESISWYCDLDARLQSLLELGASEESLGSMALGRDVVKTLINLFPRRLAEKLVQTVGEFGSREGLAPEGRAEGVQGRRICCG